MALLMFITSIGFAIDLHYCQGDLKSVSFFSEAKKCHDMVAMTNCSHHQKQQEQSQSCPEEEGCCQNETFQFQPDHELTIQTFEFVVNKQLQHFLTAYVIVLINQFDEENPITHTYYKPPLIRRDIPVLVQSFLL